MIAVPVVIVPGIGETPVRASRALVSRCTHISFWGSLSFSSSPVEPSFSFPSIFGNGYARAGREEDVVSSQGYGHHLVRGLYIRLLYPASVDDSSSNMIMIAQDLQAFDLLMRVHVPTYLPNAPAARSTRRQPFMTSPEGRESVISTRVGREE